MHLTLGFSPCPNDTFIFDAMVHGRIDTEGLTFDVYMEDVERLNERALRGELQVTKLSYFTLSFVLDRYALLQSGSALGHGCGPLLIARKMLTDEEIQGGAIAIPGIYTTAHFLFSHAYPTADHKKTYLFSEIESAVLRGEVEAGVIIHENRFTYAEKGLVKVQDLGAYWESRTGLPIPLGGIAARRDLSPEVIQKIDRVIHRSVQHAFDRPADSETYVRRHAQEMDPEVMRSHIALYVNDYTLALGEKGHRAVTTLMQSAQKMEKIA